MKIKAKLFIAMQYLLPAHFLSRIAGSIANCEISFVKNNLINLFKKAYNISLEDAILQDAKDFKSFNDFFTRELKANSRKIDATEDAISSPCDGTISQIGHIQSGKIIQAKDMFFDVKTLLASCEIAEKFEKAKFSTIYLSPSNYHRVHMPCDGVLKQMIYVPGDLFSVNQTTAENIPNLFARNERVVFIFDTVFGEMAIVMVGAIIVASIETSFAGIIAPIQREIKVTNYEVKPQTVHLKKGEELGKFKLGSTVVMLIDSKFSFNNKLQVNTKVKMGELFAKIGNNFNESSDEYNFAALAKVLALSFK